MSSAVLNGVVNTPYIASKREKEKEQYSQLWCNAKYEKVTRSMEMHARRPKHYEASLLAADRPVRHGHGLGVASRSLALE